MKRKCIEILNTIFGVGNWLKDDLYKTTDGSWEYCADDGWDIKFQLCDNEVYYSLYDGQELIERGKYA